MLLMSNCSPRLTASLLEVLLHPSNKGSSHRVLTAFVKCLTGANIVDARDLEDEEREIPAELMRTIRDYGRFTSATRVFDANGGDSYGELSSSLTQPQLIYSLHV